VVGGDDPETSPEIESAIVDVDLVGAGGACIASMTSAGPSAPVVQVNIPIVNVRPARRTMEVDYLARHRVCTHTPYLACHCQRDVVGSLLRGMPTVVDYRWRCASQ
jgi:hypothetical protein